jgi:electron transfer flavoprotein beta subunit
MALRKIAEDFGKPEIIFTGKQTIDGDTAQVGPGIAKRLEYNQLTYISRIVECDLAGGMIKVERRAEGGLQVLETRLPVLITMLEATNEMRRGSIENALSAARAEVVTWNAAAVGIEDLTKCGLRGSPTIVKKVFAPTARSEKAVMIDADGSADGRAAALVEAIFARAPSVEQDLLEHAAQHYV